MMPGGGGDSGGDISAEMLPTLSGGSRGALSGDRFCPTPYGSSVIKKIIKLNLENIEHIDFGGSNRSGVQVERGTNRPKDLFFFFFLNKQEKIIPIDGGGGEDPTSKQAQSEKTATEEYEKKEAARRTQATPSASSAQKTALPCRQSLGSLIAARCVVAYSFSDTFTYQRDMPIHIHDFILQVIN